MSSSSEPATLAMEEVEVEGNETRTRAASAAFTTADGYTDEPRLVDTIEAHSKDIMDLHVDPDGSTILSCSLDRTIACWREGVQPAGHRALASRTNPLPSQVTSVAYDPTRCHVYAGTDQGRIMIFSLTDATAAWCEEYTYPAHTSRVTCVEYCAERDIVVSVGRDKKVCVFWCTRRDFTTTRVCKAWLAALAVERPSGARCFVGAYSGAIHVVDISGAKLRVTATLSGGHSGSVRCLHYDQRLSYLFSGSFDKSVCVWNVGGITGRLMGKLRGHTDKVKAVVYAHAVRRVFSAGDDGRIIVWDTTSGTALANVRAHRDKIISLRWVGKSMELISASHDKSVKIWSFRSDHEASHM